MMDDQMATITKSDMKRISLEKEVHELKEKLRSYEEQDMNT